MKHVYISVVFIVFTVCITACSDVRIHSPEQITDKTQNTNIEDSSTIQNQQRLEKPTETLTTPIKPFDINNYSLEVVAENLYVPWNIAFTSPERMLVTERNGALRIIENGVLSPTSLHVFEEVSTISEEGLMGLAVDPKYSENQYLYICYAHQESGQLRDKIVRFKDDGDSLSDETLLLENIPAAQYHAGCRLRFGPDDKLYITTGDAIERNLAQDLDTLHGKILRINTDGSIPSDNPFENSPIWSYGHRNPQGIDWHPQTQHLYSTEHGPSVFDGPRGGDEINIIYKGENYGWPLVSHEETIDNAIDPVVVMPETEAPASGVFYSGNLMPEFQNQFFIGALKGEGILRVAFDNNAPDQAIWYEKLEGINLGRIREIAIGPNGALYFSTSNRDGRGNPDQADDRIFKLTPKK